jgi:hypothetical protein
VVLQWGVCGGGGAWAQLLGDWLAPRPPAGPAFPMACPHGPALEVLGKEAALLNLEQAAQSVLLRNYALWRPTPPFP